MCLRKSSERISSEPKNRAGFQSAFSAWIDVWTTSPFHLVDHLRQFNDLTLVPRPVMLPANNSFTTTWVVAMLSEAATPKPKMTNHQCMRMYL